MKASIFLRYGILFSLLGGCSMFSTDTLSPNEDLQTINQPLKTVPVNIHDYVKKLGKQLLLTSKAIKLNQSIAVGTFLPIGSIGSKHNHLLQTNPAGHQIQESLVTFASQAGLNVLEFKTMAGIKLQGNLDMMLSRQISELKQNINASYYLTGTYVQQGDLVIVNARLIELSTNIVIAAATDQIPASALWHQDKILMKNNAIYRQAY